MHKRFLDATRGSKFGQQLACLLLGDKQPVEKGVARFTGKAVICKDGWICWDFIGKSGETQHGHAVDRFENFKANCLGLCQHLGLTDLADERTKTIVSGFFKALDANCENYSDTAQNYQKERRGILKQVGLKLVADPDEIARVEKSFPVNP